MTATSSQRSPDPASIAVEDVGGIGAEAAAGAETEAETEAENRAVSKTAVVDEMAPNID
jgi:hypothetical protein